MTRSNITNNFMNHNNNHEELNTQNIIIHNEELNQTHSTPLTIDLVRLWTNIYKKL